MAIHIHSKAEIDKMRATGRLAAQVLEFIEPFVKPGVTTDELDRRCHDFIVEHDAIPAPLNYKGFPRSICTSINEVVCHGIPGSRTLAEGDIINIDITTILHGFHGDTSEMFLVGEVSDRARALVDVTRRSMWLGIKEVAPRKRIGDIGAAIQDFAQGEHGYGVVEAFCGHGIGRVFHTAPQIAHTGRRGTGMRMKPGMTFTIEPMINEGTHECKILDDGWTAVTLDGRLSAQTEHTILVTEDGYEVLTMRDNAFSM
ncbi:MAG: type I methionyl aminopeptidase [Myxococcales bacterium]|nr:type I methionyl aminopeptidase [Myxococcales bacterium]MCB9717903.1 type I methionyl aminopeptidase [Myxococcales bacterium]